MQTSHQNPNEYHYDSSDSNFHRPRGARYCFSTLAKAIRISKRQIRAEINRQVQMLGPAYQLLFVSFTIYEEHSRIITVSGGGAVSLKKAPEVAERLLPLLTIGVLKSKQTQPPMPWTFWEVNRHFALDKYAGYKYYKYSDKGHIINLWVASAIRYHLCLQKSDASFLHEATREWYKKERAYAVQLICAMLDLNLFSPDVDLSVLPAKMLTSIIATRLSE